MKLLSIAIPCYNSQNYMKHCIESLLIGGEQVEILIIDDGSQDDTALIADTYAKEYPTIIKSIHQPNGGHGEAVNTGLRNATGLYFKVVDSDDWVAEDAYLKILETLKQLATKDLDMLISNFVYDKDGAKKKKVMKYTKTLPSNKIFTWSEAGHFRKGNYILMHSVIYKTALLKQCTLELPKHTFYVDNIFVFKPLPYVKTIYYLDVDFYRYFIGREDQSVNEQIMIKRIDQQIKVNKIMIDYFSSATIENPKLKKYMFNYLDIMMTISSIMLILGGTPEHLNKKKELWQYLERTDKSLYHKLRYGLFGRAMNLPGTVGRKTSTLAYHLANRLFGFN